jgi:hypothetical protein
MIHNLFQSQDEVKKANKEKDRALMKVRVCGCKGEKYVYM